MAEVILWPSFPISFKVYLTIIHQKGLSRVWVANQGVPKTCALSEMKGTEM